MEQGTALYGLPGRLQLARTAWPPRPGPELLAAALSSSLPWLGDPLLLPAGQLFLESVRLPTSLWPARLWPASHLRPSTLSRTQSLLQEKPL